jgi:hypothetical protein
MGDSVQDPLEFFWQAVYRLFLGLYCFLSDELGKVVGGSQRSLLFRCRNQEEITKVIKATVHSAIKRAMDEIDSLIY